jgi:hypothetical protein
MSIDAYIIHKQIKLDYIIMGENKQSLSYNAEEHQKWDEDTHYQNPRLCRVLASLPSVFCRALGKDGFAESRPR